MDYRSVNYHKMNAIQLPLRSSIVSTPLNYYPPLLPKMQLYLDF